jgi:hypothetical protein
MPEALTIPATPATHTPDPALLHQGLMPLMTWVRAQGYAGYEPYDILNSPFFSQETIAHRLVSGVLIQLSKRWGGLRLRRWMRVPASRNPKALGLLLSAASDMAKLQPGSRAALTDEAVFLIAELERLRSPHETDFCWGYDWDFASLRGATLRKFSPNCVATVFCAEGLLDAADAFGLEQARTMACSAANFITQRLRRSRDTAEHLCFSYVTDADTLIYNNSVLAGALLARLARKNSQSPNVALARRNMAYLADAQRPDGSWIYGEGKRHQWVDGFHTGYNLCALRRYRESSADASFQVAEAKGYEYYKRECFNGDIAKYRPDSLYPIDIHSCAQAMITFAQFGDHARAEQIAAWTLQNMRNSDGTFMYQQHRWRTDRTPYMRWGQAWMAHALARVLVTAGGQPCAG